MPTNDNSYDNAYDRLATLADILADTEPAHSFDFGAQLVRIIGDELGFLDLEGEHPASLLLGFTAPAEWDAIGIVTGGWGAPRDSTVAPSAHPDAVRIRMVVVLSRMGDVVCRLRTTAGDAVDEPGDGFILDLLRRALGLPTPPPEQRTSELLSALWLSEVAAAATEARHNGGRRLTWNQVARLHPALQLLATGGARTRPRPDTLVPAAHALANVLTWTRVREQATQRTWLEALVAKDVAAWMDEGILARWLLHELGPVDELADYVVRMLRSDVAGRLTDTLAELGVGSTAAA